MPNLGFMIQGYLGVPVGGGPPPCHPQNGTAAAEGAPPPNPDPKCCHCGGGGDPPLDSRIYVVLLQGAAPPLPGICLPLLLLVQPAASYQVHHAQCGCEAVHQKNEQMLPTTSGYILVISYLIHSLWRNLCQKTSSLK